MKKQSIVLTFIFFLLQMPVFQLRAIRAQSTAGTILGAVTDSSGAIVPGVSITIRNTNTALTRTVVSDDSGNYVSPLLPAGPYELTAEQAGFNKVVVSNIVLQVDQRVRINITMKVGEIVQSVEVTGEAHLVKTDVSDVGMVVENKTVTDLPLNGRVYYHLNLLDSGTAQRTGWRTSIWAPVGGANFSFNGAPSDSNQYLVDGIMSQESTVTHPTMKVTIDAIQEFKQQASQYSAEFGHGSGAQINLVTKSGTNNFNGSVFWFLRNDALDARNFFDPPREERKALGLSPLPEFKQNQFGATIGGPVKKDSTFFFFSYEGTRIRKGITRSFSVPSVAKRNGDFVGAATIYDPLTTTADPGSPGGFSRTPFPGNVIPANRIDPVSRRVLDQLFPLPTGPGEAANLLASPTQRVDENQYTVRIDHRFNSQNSVFGRYSQTNPERVLPLTFSQLPNFADIWDQPAKNIVLSYSRIFSPRTVNELIVGYNRFVQNLLDYDYQRDVPRELGINRLDSRFGGNPAISIAGYGRTAGITNSPNNRYDNVYQLTDNFTHVQGNHSLGFGASFRHIANNRAGTQPNPRGIFNFTARYTTLPGVANTGNAMADFLLGYPTQTQGGIGHGFRYTRHNEFGAYIKDDWQVSRNLTLNLGLRYDRFGAWYEKFDEVLYFDFNTGEITPPSQYKQKGFPRSSYEADPIDLAPRFGFAYRPFGDNRTVLRGGYGIFYSFTQGYSLVLIPSNEKASYTFNADPIVPNLTLANGFPLALATQSLSVLTWEPQWKSPSSQQWSLYVQRELVSNLSVEVGYLGNKGSNVMGQREYNRPEPGSTSIVSRRRYPQYASVAVIQPYGDSWYHGLKVNVDRRFSSSMAFRASWTLAKSLNTTGLGSYGESTEVIKRSPFDVGAEKGRSPYDARHRFTLSYAWELPFGPGKKFAADAKGFVGGLIGGWQVNGITILQTGTPVDLTLASDTANSGGAGGDNRPDRIGDPNEGGAKTVQQWFNTAAFVLPRQFVWGNAGKNIITAPGITQWDISLFKNVAISENQRLQFRFEVFNFINHPNFDAPNTQFGQAQFGRILSAGEARELQFAVRYSF